MGRPAPQLPLPTFGVVFFVTTQSGLDILSEDGSALVLL